MSIKIIGAGLPRTGTNTLKECLEKLGYHKTYHMKELLVHPEPFISGKHLKQRELLSGMNYIKVIRQP